MWKVLKHRVDRAGFVVAIGSFLYGMQIYNNPNILETYRVYKIINSLLDNQLIGLIFMIISVIKIVGILLNNLILRKVGIISLSFLWGMFFVSFLISPPPNTVWTLSLTVCLTLIRASLKGDY